MQACAYLMMYQEVVLPTQVAVLAAAAAAAVGRCSYWPLIQVHDASRKLMQQYASHANAAVVVDDEAVKKMMMCEDRGERHHAWRMMRQLNLRQYALIDHC